jgi:Tfp pilus assembly protein PilN
VTQVNLLPRDIRQRATTRRRTGIVAALGGVVVAALLVIWFLQGMRLSDLNDKLDAQNATNDRLQAEVAGLQHFADEQTALEARKALLQSALANTIRWSGVLNKVSQVEPNTMWLDSLTGSITVATPGAPAPPTGGTALIGSLQFAGNALDTGTIALWLTNLETVPGWVNPWFSSASKTLVGGTPVWQFSSSVDLDTRATRSGGLP